MNLDATPSLNDSSFRNLPDGENVFQIVEAGMQPFKKNDPQGELVVHFGLKHEDGITYPLNIRVMAEGVVGDISRKTLKAFAVAGGIGGILNVERIKSFKGRWVTITAVEKYVKDGTGKDVPRVNIQTVDPAEAPAAKEEPASEPVAEYSAPAEDTTPAPEPEVSPLDSPAPAPRKRPWEEKRP